MSARTLLVWCPDWPVIAAEIVDGVPASGPVVVLHGNRVLACSETARADGVRRGLRRREAQSRCPQLIAVADDPGRDARAFEPVVAAVEEVAVGVEVIRPGACALSARGPARYFGGEEAAAERIVEQVAQACAVECQVGIADGVFAAGLAARAGRIVPPGCTRDFLAGVPVEALESALSGFSAPSEGPGAGSGTASALSGFSAPSEGPGAGSGTALTDLLRRLGIKTLGDFAALPAADVLSRFGFDGVLAHRLAGGHDHRPLAVRTPPPDLDVTETYDEALERVDVAAFAGRALAERLHERLAAYGLACTRLGIEAVTADGQELHRVWRHDGMLTAATIAERVRWQLDGWLTGARRRAVLFPGATAHGEARPTAGIVRLRLIPDGVLVHLGLQSGLWGDAGTERERAHRALSRIQGLLGPDAVVTAVPGGGRSADDQVRFVPWGDERVPERPAAEHTEPIPGTATVPVLTETLRLVTTPDDGDAELAGGDRTAAPPWPGRLAMPSPALVLTRPQPAVVIDAAGTPVGVSARLELTGDPTALLIGNSPPVEITGWAGPWPVDERWWAPAEARRRARFQIGLADGRAFLLSLSGGHWAVEAVYD